MTLACKYNKACQWARLVVWLNLNILAHLAHLAQSYFSLIFSAINTYNCLWFDLTNRKICSDWKQKHSKKWSVLTTFFLTATAAITGIFINFWYLKIFLGVQSPCLTFCDCCLVLDLFFNGRDNCWFWYKVNLSSKS